MSATTDERVNVCRRDILQIQELEYEVYTSARGDVSDVFISHFPQHYHEFSSVNLCNSFEMHLCKNNIIHIFNYNSKHSPRMIFIS